MVDPNCRPTFIPDRERYRRGLGATLALRARRQGRRGGPRVPRAAAPPADAARALLADGPARRAGHPRRRGRADRHRGRRGDACRRPKVEVVDTIGAGDAFGGGFLAYWRMRERGPRRWRRLRRRRRGRVRLPRGRAHVRPAGRLAAAAVRSSRPSRRNRQRHLVAVRPDATAVGLRDRPQIARPSPLPPVARPRAASTRKKRSKTRSAQLRRDAGAVVGHRHAGLASRVHVVTRPRRRAA